MKIFVVLVLFFSGLSSAFAAPNLIKCVSGNTTILLNQDRRTISYNDRTIATGDWQNLSYRASNGNWIWSFKIVQYDGTQITMSTAEGLPDGRTSRSDADLQMHDEAYNRSQSRFFGYPASYDSMVAGVRIESRNGQTQVIRTCRFMFNP